MRAPSSSSCFLPFYIFLHCITPFGFFPFWSKNGSTQTTSHSNNSNIKQIKATFTIHKLSDISPNLFPFICSPSPLSPSLLDHVGCRCGLLKRLKVPSNNPFCLSCRHIAVNRSAIQWHKDKTRLTIRCCRINSSFLLICQCC